MVDLKKTIMCINIQPAVLKYMDNNDIIGITWSNKLALPSFNVISYSDILLGVKLVQQFDLFGLISKTSAGGWTARLSEISFWESWRFLRWTSEESEWHHYSVYVTLSTTWLMTEGTYLHVLQWGSTMKGLQMSLTLFCMFFELLNSIKWWEKACWNYL